MVNKPSLDGFTITYSSTVVEPSPIEVFLIKR